jgi:hypothetical protein
MGLLVKAEKKTRQRQINTKDNNTYKNPFGINSFSFFPDLPIYISCSIEDFEIFPSVTLVLKEVPPPVIKIFIISPTSCTPLTHEKAGCGFLKSHGLTLGQQEMYGTLLSLNNSKDTVPKPPNLFCKFTDFIFLNGTLIMNASAAPFFITTLFSETKYTVLYT